MATATIRPNATIYGGGTLTGGAGSTHATLADDSDGTYASKAAGSPPDHVSMGTTTKPAGSALTSIRPWMKLQSSSGTTKANFTVPQVPQASVTGLSVNNTPTIYYGPTFSVGDQSQAWINALEMTYSTPSGSNTRFLEAGIDLVFPEPPTCAITAPTGTITASSFTIAWTHTPGTNGGAQAAYQVRIFTSRQYLTDGFDEDTTPPHYESGTVASQAASMVGLLSAGLFDIYIRTAQSIGGGTLQWSDWDHELFTVSLTTSEVLEVNAAAEPTNGSVEIIVDIDPATDTASYVELERSIAPNEIIPLGIDGTFESGYGGETSVTGLTSADVPAGFLLYTGGGNEPASPTCALLTATGWDDNYCRIGGTFDDGDRLLLQTGTGLAFDVSPGDTIAVEAMIHSGLGANCVGRLLIAFFDEALNFVSSVEAEIASLSAWRPYWFYAATPTGARYANGGVSIVGGTGASGAVCLLAVDNFYMGKDPTWTPVRGVEDIAVASDQVTLFDYAAPPDTEVRYRARAVKDDGTLGDWDYTPEPFLSWEVVGNKVWVNALDDPSLNTQFKISAAPSATRTQRRAVFPIDGSPFPVVVSDVRSAREITFEFQTATDDEAAALLALADEDIVLVHAPESFGVASGFWSFGDVQEVHFSDLKPLDNRRWRIDAVEVDEP
jgi:hypothetical protein